MKISKFIVLIIGISLCYSCQHASNKNPIRKTSLPKDSVDKKNKLVKATEQGPPLGTLKNDSIAMEQIENLPEYKILRKQFHKLNRDTSNHFAVLLAARPDSSFKYYWVKLGEDNPERFHAWADFYVDPKNMAVSYYDTVADSILTLKEWRKNGKYYPQ